MNKSELPEEITALIEKAEAGDVAAQFLLGVKYRNGRDIEQDYKESIYWIRKAVRQKHSAAQNCLGLMYDLGQGVKQNKQRALAYYKKAADQGYHIAQRNLGIMYLYGDGVKRDYDKALELFLKSAKSTNQKTYFDSIELRDKAERYMLSESITAIRDDILKCLRVDIEKTPTMTHYTSLSAGHKLLFEESPLRLGHINALNDPNEGKLLWHYLGHVPTEGKPVFVGCFLPDEDSLNMWRFYSKNLNNDDACGCAITYKTDIFFDFNLLNKKSVDTQKSEPKTAFSNTGNSPEESTTFYRVIYIKDDMNVHGDDEEGTIKNLLTALKDESEAFLNSSSKEEKKQQLSRLLGPLPFLLKDADYEAENEHRIIVTHLEYGANEIKVFEPTFENGLPQASPKLYLELHRINHLAPIKHVTLGPKAPHQEMMAPYWHHKLASEFSDQLKTKPDFYVRASKCAYK
ncbi:tetratricopeptide repeat protein [Aeromonas media]|uniref:Tetratricopeptide repeat protein n=1 Tax=Aeromonas media TaxID=651 RepID=A0AAP6L0Y1_AERME|nr:tetratricopeptide repeat protein [Aeromonas media]MDX7921639.1 tetratricopeptide repeat protein [Aeromonas media]